tara:strand:- start:957 stop:1562 length:606 start_codon:yes stop_codon:yes gene_type:complete
MSFLSIDCSTEVGSIFVKTKYKSFIKILQSDKSSIDLLMKQILEFLNKNDIEFDDISRIYVNQGPGNFSGLRGSLATAKGISISKNLQLFGYNTFIWSCIKFFDKANDIYSLTKFREKYFLKKFDKSLKNSSKIEEVSETEILKKYGSKFKVIPKNVVKNFNEKILNLKNLNIVELDHNDLEFLYLKGLLDKDLIKPLYLS